MLALALPPFWGETETQVGRTGSGCTLRLRRARIHAVLTWVPPLKGPAPGEFQGLVSGSKQIERWGGGMVLWLLPCPQRPQPPYLCTMGPRPASSSAAGLAHAPWCRSTWAPLLACSAWPPPRSSGPPEGRGGVVRRGPSPKPGAVLAQRPHQSVRLGTHLIVRGVRLVQLV